MTLQILRAFKAGPTRSIVAFHGKAFVWSTIATGNPRMLFDVSLQTRDEAWKMLPFVKAIDAFLSDELRDIGDRQHAWYAALGYAT